MEFHWNLVRIEQIMENAGTVSTVKQLEKENEKLRQIILVQNKTINRLIDRYILKKELPKTQ